MLDTNICIYLINKRPQIVVERLKHVPVGEVGLSVITLCELEYGVQNSAQPDRNRAALLQFILPLVVCDLTFEMTLEYGRIRCELKKQQIGIHDLLIAAHAIQLDTTLVTNNTREFSRVRGLRLEDWAKA
jgi:tRNA(fMet)-specific endonuclease VapC